jgi:hypothetical protein
MPASIRSATRSACSGSFVITYEPSPNGVSFAAHRLLLRRHAIDLGDRAEQLFTVDVVLRRDVRQHRRLEVVAVALAAGDDRRALLDRAPDLILEAVGAT